MDAIARIATGPELRVVPVPEPGPGEVRVRVAMAGICRTDLAAADGRLGAADGLVLGHEFSGCVDATGPGVAGVAPGARVTVMPALPCGACRGCEIGSCESPSMLGVHRDGGFAEYVVVPEASVYPIPEALDLQRAAYTEPVAASLAVVKAGITREQRGAIAGTGRIAELTRRIMAVSGFEGVELLDRETLKSLETSSFDWVVETIADTEVFAELVRLVRPRGRIVVKTRAPELVGVHLPTLLLKELTIEAVNYGSFERSIELLCDPALQVDDLFGARYPLRHFRSAFDAARGGEAKKLFFAIGPEVS